MKKFKLLMPLIVSAGVLASCAGENLTDPKTMAEGTYNSIINTVTDFANISTEYVINSGDIDVSKTLECKEKDTTDVKYTENTTIKIDKINATVHDTHSDLDAYDETNGNTTNKAMGNWEDFTIAGKGGFKHELGTKADTNDSEKGFEVNLAESTSSFVTYINNNVEKKTNDTNYGFYLDLSKSNSIQLFRDLADGALSGSGTYKEDVDDIVKALKEIIKKFDEERSKKKYILCANTSTYLGEIDLVQFIIDMVSSELLEAKTYIEKEENVLKEYFEKLFTYIIGLQSKITAGKDGDNYKYTVNCNHEDIKNLAKLEGLEILSQLPLTGGTLKFTAVTSSDNHLLNYNVVITNLKADPITNTYTDDSGNNITETYNINDICLDLTCTFDRSKSKENIENEINTATGTATEWTKVNILD